MPYDPDLDHDVEERDMPAGYHGCPPDEDDEDDFDEDDFDGEEPDDDEDDRSADDADDWED